MVNMISPVMLLEPYRLLQTLQRRPHVRVVRIVVAEKTVINHFPVLITGYLFTP